MRRRARTGICGVLLSSSLFLGPTVFAAPRQQDAQPPAADNSKVNRDDGNKGVPTADQQKTNSSDQMITKNIRSAVVKDKSLSTYAHNIKIITQDGKVTLKGPVRSDEEKTNIAAKAVAIAGADSVVNQLTVAPEKP
jgi:hyperosmotically inducible protein